LASFFSPAWWVEVLLCRLLCKLSTLLTQFFGVYATLSLCANPINVFGNHDEKKAKVNICSTFAFLIWAVSVTLKQPLNAISKLT